MTRFLMGVQLPRRLAHSLREQGWEVVHALDLPNGNRTSDAENNLLLSQIASLFEIYDYVELGRDQLIAHQ